MTVKPTVAIGLGLACLVALSALASAADWPQWGRTYDRNMISPEKGLPETFVPGEKDPKGGGIRMDTTQNVRWAARLGGYAYGNPTVAGGRVFVGTDDQTLEGDPRLRRVKGGMVKCFDEATGKLLWQLAVPPRTHLGKEFHFGQQHLGLCSSPAVDGDRVYVVAQSDEVLCLDVRGQANGNDGPFMDEGQYMVGPDQPPVKIEPTDGDIIWKYNIIDELKVVPHDIASCAILVHGDFLYLSTSNGVDKSHEKAVAPDAPVIIALNKHTGKLAAVEKEGISRRTWHTQWCSPSLGKVGDKTLVFFGGTDGFCYAFEALTQMPAKPVTLKKVWSYDGNPPEFRLRDGKPIHYMSGDKRRKDSPNKNDGLYLGPSEILATPVFYKDRVYVSIGQDTRHGAAPGLLSCIDATGSGDLTDKGRIWEYDKISRTLSTVAIADGLLYVADVTGAIHCLDADTGKPQWVFQTGSLVCGSTLVADGKVYLGTEKGDLWVLAAGRETKLLGKVHLGSAIYTTPVAANGVLYVATCTHLFAFQEQDR